VLEDDIGIDEIEELIGEHSKAVAWCDVDVGMGDAAESLARLGRHLRGDIHTVDLAEMRAHGKHQATGAAADFKRAPRLHGRFRQADQLPSEGV